MAMCDASLSGADPDEVRSDVSHWSLEHDRSLSRDISTVSGVEDGYRTRLYSPHQSVVTIAAATYLRAC